MRGKKTDLRYTKERAILSDVLPYELPLTFSNRHFYEFLRMNKVEYRGKSFYWGKKDPALDIIICLLCGVSKSARIITTNRNAFGRAYEENTFQNAGTNFVSIPFGYKIRHKDNEFRELTVCHPRNQIQLIDFYHRYKELILFYCGLSPFSIRRPTRVSRFVFHRDGRHFTRLSSEPLGVEESDKEYENLRSFFVYEDYSHIFKFYESPAFHNYEKKYNNLLKLDVTKCFDSIYTHSLSWALYGKETVKEQIPSLGETFADSFDKLMQAINYQESNGIVIGPEFSRIFAELILQSVDRAVCSALQPKSIGNAKSGCRHKHDYQICRYVDDYFVFYNEDWVKDRIVQTLQLKLSEHKLYLNKSKAVIFEKPIITNISMAKQRIAALFDEKLKYVLENFVQFSDAPKPGTSVATTRKVSIRLNSTTLITQFKTIIKDAAVDYKDTLNYSLAIVERKTAKILEDYRKLVDAEKSDKDLCQAVVAICEFIFFIYSVSPRVHTTIRLCRILVRVTSFLREKGTNKDLKHAVLKVLFDNICQILDKFRNPKHTPVETLYLLIALTELGKDYWLESSKLCEYFSIDLAGQSVPGGSNPHLNYISLVVLLFYIKDKQRHDEVRNALEETIKDRFESRKATLLKDTELTLLLLDCIACPFLKPSIKAHILTRYGITDPYEQHAVMLKRRFWFTKWVGFNFSKELDAKQSLEVY